MVEEINQMIRNIFYKNYTSKWQNILTIAHLIFIIVFTTWVILIRLYNSSFAGLLITSLVLGVGLSLLKTIAVKKNNEIYKNEKFKIIDRS